MPDLEISRLPELLGPGLASADVLPVSDLSASETKKITAKDLVQSGVTLIDSASIPWDKIDSPTSTIPDGSITTAKLQDGAVTDVKISDVDGSKINDGSITGAKFGNVADRGLDVTLDKIGITNSIIPGDSAGISWNEHGLITGAVSPIPVADLPLATTTSVGAVSVPTSGGLAVDGTGEISIAYTTTPNIVANVAYNEFGQILYVNDIEPGHLPVATNSTIGAAQYPLTGGLLVDGNGNVTLGDTSVIPGEYTKVTVDQQGRVTNGGLIESSDIPPLSADKIQSGVLSADRIGSSAITRAKLADYSVSYIQEAIPQLTGNHIGTLWYQESTAGLHMWNGNSWMPISIGRLSQENLRYSGTIDASTGLITGVTSFGVAAGYNIGDALKNATDQLTGTYFVVDVAGSGIPQVAVIGVAFDPGDWVLCNGAAAGYARIDTLNGGSGGASRLGDLLDVTLTTPVQGSALQLDSNNQWVNVTQFDEGTYS
jgi:hypothetical protein